MHTSKPNHKIASFGFLLICILVHVNFARPLKFNFGFSSSGDDDDENGFQGFRWHSPFRPFWKPPMEEFVSLAHNSRVTTALSTSLCYRLFFTRRDVFNIFCNRFGSGSSI